jgi:hypothetical protein
VRARGGSRWNSEQSERAPENRASTVLNRGAACAPPNRNRGANDDETDRNADPERRDVEQIRSEREPYDADDDGDDEETCGH